MTTTITEHLKSIATYFVALIFVVSGVGLFLFYSAEKSGKEFTTEATIAKYGAMIYVISGIGIAVIKIFLQILS
ncbi:MAG TPA: hypothetical protein VFD89_08300 [Clostridia bacterium]|nr:hypothetical protein [Clostridia bacterium]